MKILYHLVAGVNDWSESAKVTHSISNAKGECLNHIEAKTGLVYDKPTDKRGNTNCGPIATKFFSPTLRPEICVLIKNSEDRENFIHLLKLMNAYIHIIESYDNDLWDCRMVRKAGIESMLHIRNGFLNHKGESWIYIIPCVHQVCAHAGELFEMNLGKAISVWSENPVAGTNLSGHTRME